MEKIVTVLDGWKTYVVAIVLVLVGAAMLKDGQTEAGMTTLMTGLGFATLSQKGNRIEAAVKNGQPPAEDSPPAP